MRAFKLIVLLALLLAALARAATPDEDFLAAREAYRSQNGPLLDSLAAGLQGHPLESYVTYYQLLLRLKEADPGEIRSFLVRNADSPLADRLRTEWARLLGQSQEWAAFLAEFAQLLNPDTELVCYALQARLQRNDPEALKEARPLWFSGSATPESCSPLFETMLANDQLTANDVWERMRLALDAGNLGLARQINGYLPEGQALNVKLLASVYDKPQRYLEKRKLSLSTRTGRELALFAVLRLARTQPEQAADYWEEMQDRFSARDRGYVWGQIAYRAALRHEPAALAWFGRAGDALGDRHLAWRARLALRAQDWPEVLASIERMSAAARQDSTWRYWKARALKAQGQTQEANAIFLQLSRETNFYGLLAAEELGPVLGNPPETWKAGAEEIKAIEQIPGIQRALLLNRLGLPVEATREWQWATRGFDDRQLLAAAELARRNGWIERAISTAERTRELHDFELRYPTPYREVVQDLARTQQLDEAWVYGLVRQESRFMAEVRSSAGALGLMQLMPATARWVAKRLGLKDFHQSMITHVETNVVLGTYYLRYVLDELGDPVMATAAYNAGPGRARRWVDVRPLEGAIYAETIPFDETRDYVKKVMSNAVFYAQRLGLQWRSLKQRLGTIPGRALEIEQSAELAPADGVGNSHP